VKHCPFACSERRSILEKHLEERGFTDVVWCTKYSKSNPFVEWIHEKFNKRCSVEGISGLIKLYECMLMFIEDEMAGDRAVFCDDDVVFIDGAKDAINSLPNYPFINLSVGIFYHIYPTKTIIENDKWNNGGSEAVIMTREFCKFLIENFDLRAGMDHVISGIVYKSNLKLYMVPIAQQTSLLTKVAHFNDPISTEIWIDFILGYKPTGISYIDLWKESGIPKEDKMDEYKKMVEEDFYKMYNQRIDIKNLNYIALRASTILLKIQQS
jgi:hypothetical protein